MFNLLNKYLLKRRETKIMGKLKNYVMEYAEKNNISFEEAITELGGEL